ncbi:TonB-dependent receptor [Pedobacter polaris]|uniref:TonB-dependent receptor n=1 Tax=Pedobacter polaris TaxID=2571273 RepID=A0A4V5P031_9SPHI|nr:outer membrane beta-barrel family protein [Pedobacter polaris]TKC10302.1 TonB-dependent receptor [Pedobacter polaris]
MKKKLIFILLLICTLQSFAQNTKSITIKGKIIEAQTKQPIENAGITVLSSIDQKYIKGIATNKNGEFTLTIPPGKYHIRIEFISFKSILLENRQIDSDLDLEIISLKEDTKLLKSVEVIGEKSTSELNLDKKVFNVGKDLMSKGGSANDILNNVPSVNVDANGAISLRGNTGVRILINGKPSMMSMNNGLQQIPASNIEKIEVITNPSARYEAQGGAGIINIVLKKNNLTGLNGSIQAGMGDPTNYTSNINLSYKTEKINLFTNFGLRLRDFIINDERKQTTLNNSIKNVLFQNNVTNRTDESYDFYIGGDYYIDAKNTLTGSFYHSTLIINNKIDYNYNYFNANNTRDSTIYRFEHYKEPKKYNQLELYHVKTFNNKNKKWATSLQYDFWNDDENQNINQQKIFPIANPINNLISKNIESSNDIFIQSDFITTFGESGRFETGIRSDLRAIRSDYLAKSNDVLLTQYNNKLNYDENLFSGYFQIGNKINKFNYLLGLRSELSIIGISDRAGTFRDHKEYINLFPTAHFIYNLQKTTDLQLSYSRRIDRPQFWQLNPFGGLSDTRNLTIGNPDLDPTYTNSFEFALLKKWTKFTITPSIYYSSTKNYFQYVLKQLADGSFLRTPVNLDFEERYGLEVSSSYNPFSWWRLSLNFNYYGFKQEGEFEGKRYNSDDKTWTTQINTRIKLPKSLAIESLFSYRGRFKDIQSINKAVYRANIAISKDLFKEKMTFNIAVNNIFNSNIDRQELNTPTYQLESTFRSIRRAVNLGIVYRFNRKKGEKDRLPGEN